MTVSVANLSDRCFQRQSKGTTVEAYEVLSDEQKRKTCPISYEGVAIRRQVRCNTKKRFLSKGNLMRSVSVFIMFYLPLAFYESQMLSKCVFFESVSAFFLFRLLLPNPIFSIWPHVSHPPLHTLICHDLVAILTGIHVGRSCWTLGCLQPRGAVVFGPGDNTWGGMINWSTFANVSMITLQVRREGTRGRRHGRRSGRDDNPD